MSIGHCPRCLWLGVSGEGPEMLGCKVLWRTFYSCLISKFGIWSPFCHSDANSHAVHHLSLHPIALDWTMCTLYCTLYCTCNMQYALPTSGSTTLYLLYSVLTMSRVHRGALCTVHSGFTLHRGCTVHRGWVCAQCTYPLCTVQVKKWVHSTVHRGWVQRRIMEIGRGCPEIPPSSVNTIIAPPAPAEDDDDAAPCCRMMMMLPPVAWGDIVKRRWADPQYLLMGRDSLERREQIAEMLEVV